MQVPSAAAAVRPTAAQRIRTVTHQFGARARVCCAGAARAFSQCWQSIFARRRLRANALPLVNVEDALQPRTSQIQTAASTAQPPPGITFYASFSDFSDENFVAELNKTPNVGTLRIRIDHWSNVDPKALCPIWEALPSLKSIVWVGPERLYGDYAYETDNEPVGVDVHVPEGIEVSAEGMARARVWTYGADRQLQFQGQAEERMW